MICSRERSVWLRYSALYGVVALMVVSSFLSPYFLTLDNLFYVLRQWSMVALISVGMTFVMLAGTACGLLEGLIPLEGTHGSL